MSLCSKWVGSKRIGPDRMHQRHTLVSVRPNRFKNAQRGGRAIDFPSKSKKTFTNQNRFPPPHTHTTPHALPPHSSLRLPQLPTIRSLPFEIEIGHGGAAEPLERVDRDDLRRRGRPEALAAGAGPAAGEHRQQRQRAVPHGALRRPPPPARHARHPDEPRHQVRPPPEGLRRPTHRVHLQSHPKPQVYIHIYVSMMSLQHLS